MKRILNIIGIFFLSIIVFTSCQKSPEELNEGSPQTRAAGVTGTYYWYNGEKIYLTPKNDKQFILFKTSDANSLSSLLQRPHRAQARRKLLCRKLFFHLIWSQSTKTTLCLRRIIVGLRFPQMI